MEKKVAIIGSGVTGLGAAWHLCQVGYDFTLFESKDFPGGHATTINVPVEDGNMIPVDDGFIVFNKVGIHCYVLSCCYSSNYCW